MESFQEEHARESAKIGDKVKAMQCDGPVSDIFYPMSVIMLDDKILCQLYCSRLANTSLH